MEPSYGAWLENLQEHERKADVFVPLAPWKAAFADASLRLLRSQERERNLKEAEASRTQYESEDIPF